MNATLRLAVGLATLFAGTGLLTGCVERRFVITTDPPGAIAYDEKGERISREGGTPVDREFIYNGTYQFTFVHDGYETLVVREKVSAPFYEWFLVDFISENLIPWTIRDIRRFNYQLQPKQAVSPETVRDNANTLRQRGLAIGVPPANQPQGAGPVSATLMPAP